MKVGSQTFYFTIYIWTKVHRFSRHNVVDILHGVAVGIKNIHSVDIDRLRTCSVKNGWQGK